ncbi:MULTISPECIES: carbohydrate ABC transporter permease [Streptomyces]|uniref:Carbohydrate ABC transporter permease n=1 Tax=Streptomyces griseiscabiei TaxID=2993540 RepID=A0ABU4L868_9ACTN|nr:MULTISPECIES: carbohydrate ABC transporter permease [Streptomyces]MBZ3906233.1 carbohydrate ABC transporter permease [Streptomyces griseiscabiei]MDX2911228.1 carbohydrate ABC transporter permease [Streptomyces griseiscabiei]
MTDRTVAKIGTFAPPVARTRTTGPTRRRVRSLLKHAALIACALLMLYPVLWMVVSSLRPSNEIFRNAGIALTDLRVQNYSNGWDAFGRPFSHYLVNSLIVVVGAIIGNLLACALAAYAFARLEFRAKRLWFALMLVTIMLPIHVLIVPQYVMYSQLGWVNTFLPLIVPKFLATDAFFIFLMVQFIRGIPRELDEAATIDGAGQGRIFFRIILPLMIPALATTAIFTFIWTWNDFYTQLIYLTDPDKYTTPIALRALVDQQSATDWGSVFSMSVMTLVPVFLVFLFGQRFLLRGIATTGGK